MGAHAICCGIQIRRLHHAAGWARAKEGSDVDRLTRQADRREHGVEQASGAIGKQCACFHVGRIGHVRNYHQRRSGLSLRQYRWSGPAALGLSRILGEPGREILKRFGLLHCDGSGGRRWRSGSWSWAQPIHRRFRRRAINARHVPPCQIGAGSIGQVFRHSPHRSSRARG